MDQATLLRVGNFDAPTAAQLASDTGSLVESLNVAGPLDVTKYVSELTVSGTMAFTLAAPTFAGQRKLIRCVAATSTPLATLTLTGPDATTGFVCATTFQFDTVGQAIELRATVGLKWRCESVRRAGGPANGVVIGTTVLTGVNLWATYLCSVTGTVSSTTTKGLPNGSAVGEMCQVAVSTAASIPSGTMSLAGLTNAGAAATTIGTMAGTANYITLIWNGSAWYGIGNSTLVLS